MRQNYRILGIIVAMYRVKPVYNRNAQPRLEGFFPADALPVHAVCVNSSRIAVHKYWILLISRFIFILILFSLIKPFFITVIQNIGIFFVHTSKNIRIIENKANIFHHF